LLATVPPRRLRSLHAYGPRNLCVTPTPQDEVAYYLCNVNLCFHVAIVAHALRCVKHYFSLARIFPGKKRAIPAMPFTFVHKKVLDIPARPRYYVPTVRRGRDQQPREHEMNTMFHSSPDSITTITDGGMFGGVFATCSRSAAASHGCILHVIESPRPLTDYAMNYEIEGAWEIALEIAAGNEAIADAIMSPGCASDDAESGWEYQRLRGVLAARLGYTSVEMLDEHGTTWLCLPGCSVRLANDLDA